MSVDQPELKRGCKIDNFRLLRKIGHGGYGNIFIVQNSEDHNFYAMKIERSDVKGRGLKYEIRFSACLQNSLYFPQVYKTAETDKYRYIIMEILGPSFANLKAILPRQRFSKYSTFYAGYHMLKCIEELHRRGFAHRDIKPGNFLLRPNFEYPICLIDFGLSRSYVDGKTGRILPPRDHPGFVGTSRYASINALAGGEQILKDDLISWFYTMVDMTKGLPWSSSKDREKVKIAKKNTSGAFLCKGLPEQMIQIYEHIKTLDFYSKPDYELMYHLLEEAIAVVKKDRKCFDWDKLKRRDLKKISGIDIRNVNEDGKCPVFYKTKDIGSSVCTIQ
ncbi:CK1 family protein kinase [Histomonas meleagridis]|uniref:CK1 family protein kinase n=1 Tax=Histomonas meleagridis TaxID=135588 RepID=UPI0035595F30|nr:CK1 family protein kinase [Histomonas meleagridis]KAH0803609.1 CK1 family protein kinase [Histomonas meleagridis]